MNVIFSQSSSFTIWYRSTKLPNLGIQVVANHTIPFKVILVINHYPSLQSPLSLFVNFSPLYKLKTQHLWPTTKPMSVIIQNIITPHLTLISINIVVQLPLKLTTMDYLIWKLQFQFPFFNYDLLGYINSIKSCLAIIITVIDENIDNHNISILRFYEYIKKISTNILEKKYW